MNAKQLTDKILGYRPRSQPYRMGMQHILAVKLGETPKGTKTCPHKLGTAESDAWFSGCERGHFEYNMMKEQNHG